uniref:Ribosomal protein S2 n=1 Tax=Chloropicon primus TaxID=1764295 RepID=A0A4D6C462_9CHLO|nr:ribosomal protein S2 [Chloropicon primus]QBX98471.1 ribosomal protein S2 [Chloropicon primus]
MNMKSLMNTKFSLTSILKVGGHLGRPEVHRSQKSLCIGQKNGFWIYDGEVMKQSLQVSYLYLKYFMDRKEPILVINQEDSLKKGVRVFCNKLGFYHMQEKWMGGLLTNWGQAKKQRKNFLKVRKTHGEILEKNKDRLYLKVKDRFEGLEDMPRRPSLCIILDIQDSEYAFKEALKLKIPVMAFVNTDDSLEGISFPIFGANKSLRWVRWVFNLFLYWYSKEEGKGWEKTLPKNKNLSEKKRINHEKT